MRAFAGSEVGLTRTACRAFLLTVLAMGAATVGYFLATALAAQRFAPAPMRNRSIKERADPATAGQPTVRRRS